MVDGTIVYRRDATTQQIGSLRELYENIAFYFETEASRLDLQSQYFEVTLATGVVAIIEVTDVANDKAICSLRLPIEDKQSDRDDYADVIAGLELWGSIQDVVSEGFRKGRQATMFDSPVIISIDDYRSFLPSSESYDWWQAVIAANPREKLGSDRLPEIDYTDVDFDHLHTEFGNPEIALIERAIQNIVRRNNEAAESTSVLTTVDHISLFTELAKLSRQSHP